ncbi:MAG: hypothetical protein C0399_03950, partial [Syntrophus sp. (in: bacteria)]|nr:hypothetical protein [Syntrophus sp. (in: bacteria)]
MESWSLTAITDFLPDATFAIDIGGYVIVWNRAMEIMTGVHREDMLGKGDYAYSIPFYGKRRSMLIDLVMHEGKESDVSYNYIKKQGNTIYAEDYVPVLNDGMGAYLWGTAAPLLDDNGDYQGALESIRDITERVLIEKKLMDSERKFRGLAEKSVAGVYLVQDGVFKYVNLKLAQISGYSIDEMIDKVTIEDVVFPEDWPIVEENVRKRLSGELESLHYEFRIRTKNQQVKNTEVYSSLTVYQGRPAVIGTLLDITQRKLAENALEEERQRFLILTDEAPFGIVLFNRGGTYTYLNRKFKEIFGYDLYDIPDGRTWFRKAYPDAGHRHKAIEAWFSDVDKIEENISMTVEEKWIFTVICKDKKEKIICFIMLRLPTGEYLMTCEDITERKKTEEALEKREAELEIKSINLEEMNAALKVLLKERENDKMELEEKILSNVKDLVFPYIEKLKKSRIDSQCMTYVNIVETNLNDIVSPFLQKMGLKYANLTPTEIEIAN